MPETYSFALAETERKVARSPANKTAQRFLDFCVGEGTLYPTVFAEGYDNITPLWLDAGPFAAQEATRAIDRLLGLAPGDAPGNRVSVYVCPECGDLGCGALTVHLRVAKDVVVWTDWAYQNNYDETLHPVRSERLTELQFERKQYQTALEGARVQVARDR